MAVLWLLSVTFTVKLDVPAAVGTPLMVPFVDSPRPDGKLPEAIVQLYGGLPLMAVSVAE